MTDPHHQLLAVSLVPGLVTEATDMAFLLAVVADHWSTQTLALIEPLLDAVLNDGCELLLGGNKKAHCFGQSFESGGHSISLNGGDRGLGMVGQNSASLAA